MEKINQSISNRTDKSEIVRIAVMCTSMLMIMSTLLPYVKIIYDDDIVYNDSFRSGNGIFFFVLGGLAIVFIAIREKIPVLVVSILLSFTFIVDLFNSIKMKEQFENDLRFTLGFYLVRLTSLLVIISCIYYFVTKKASRSNDFFDSSYNNQSKS